jgi:hypothetical protein
MCAIGTVERYPGRGEATQHGSACDLHGRESDGHAACTERVDRLERPLEPTRTVGLTPIHE